MFNRSFLHFIVYFAILLTINSMVMLEHGSREVKMLAPSIYAGEEIQEETLLPELKVDNKDDDLDLNIHNQGRYIKKEVLNQEYINNIPRTKGEKIAYLTFDDGPSPGVTTDILEILKAEEIIATFFVLGKSVEEYPHILRAIHDEGHVIGNHTYSHNYGRIYKNPNQYMEDLLRGEEVIKSILGDEFDLTLTRFPGGSFGKSKESFRKRVNEEGYVYVDWNSLNGDGERAVQTEEYLLKRFRATTHNKASLVILMHDTVAKTTTVKTLPTIIKELKKAGYEFRGLPQHIETELIRDYSVKVLKT